MQREQTLQERRRLYAEATRIVERDAAFSRLSLRGVADELAVSERQVQRVFRQFAGTTFRHHVLRVRMERAAVLLREEPRRAVPSRSVPEVAAMVGYSDRSSGFVKAFRRYWGSTPHQVRR
jgi:AraC-like DNA-binding protein